MHFASDNWAGAHPKIMQAMTSANDGYWPAYGNSDRDERLDARFADVFETEVAVFLVSTGTAANALALSAMARPGDVAFCHTEAHIRVDECGAPHFLAPGLQMMPVTGSFGKIDEAQLGRAVETVAGGGLNAGRVGMLSLTQATECGTLYAPDEIEALVKTIRSNRSDAPVHMDGARFANALAATGATPAEVTWKRGIDILCLGGTKNGCWCAEAILVFRPDLVDDMIYLRKRAGHLLSKMRFMTAQFEAYLDEGLWLELATKANDQAAKLEAAITTSNSVRLAWTREVNEVFGIVERNRFAQWQAQGLKAYDWQPPTAERELLDENETMFRLVTCYATSDNEVEAFERLLR
ncbi:MAG: beta-eliminating lyase-related protein [Pseudomonadota bacterium]